MDVMVLDREAGTIDMASWAGDLQVSASAAESGNRGEAFIVYEVYGSVHRAWCRQGGRHVA